MHGSQGPTDGRSWLTEDMVIVSVCLLPFIMDGRFEAILIARVLLRLGVAKLYNQC